MIKVTYIIKTESVGAGQYHLKNKHKKMNIMEEKEQEIA